MGLGLALVALGLLILLDRMGAGYGLREGWPWIVVALGVILGAKYYSLHISIPGVIRTYFLPVLLIVIGLLWLWKYKKD